MLNDSSFELNAPPKLLPPRTPRTQCRRCNKRAASRSPSLGDRSPSVELDEVFGGAWLLSSSHGQLDTSYDRSSPSILRAQSPFTPVSPCWTPEPQSMPERRMILESLTSMNYGDCDDSYVSQNSSVATPNLYVASNLDRSVGCVSDASSPRIQPSRVLPTPDQRVFDDTRLMTSARRVRMNPPTPPIRNSLMRQRRKNSLFEKKQLFAFDKFENAESLFEEQFEMQLIGEGCFFHVYRAQRKTDGQCYAVKKSKRLFTSKRDREHYLQEVRSVGLLPSNPNIVQYLRAWQEDLHFFIQMEFCVCNARELAVQLRARDEMSVQFVWKVLLDLCQGLVKVHACNLLHLDIKPDNVLFGQDGNFKLGDFGQSVLRDSWEDGGEGDGRYMAPELLDVRQRPDSSADMFSVGCCILEVATGFDLPANGPDWHLIRQGRFYQLLENANVVLDSALIQVLTGLLRVQPELRLTAAEVVTQYGHFHPKAMPCVHLSPVREDDPAVGHES